MTNAPGQKTEGVVVVQPGRHAHDSASRALSRLLRDEGIARANGNADRWWQSCADAAIKHLAALGQPFTADDVNALVPPSDHPCRMGSRFHAAIRAGVVRQVGYALSDRPSRRSGVLRLYVGHGT